MHAKDVLSTEDGVQVYRYRAMHGQWLCSNINSSKLSSIFLYDINKNIIKKDNVMLKHWV